MPSSEHEHSSDSVGARSNPTVGQAITAYLSSIPQAERTGRAQDLNSFVRWFGAQRPVASITPLDLERYQEQMEGESRTDSTGRLQSLRDFLTKAKRQGWTERNLAVDVKLRRKGASQARAKRNGEPRQGAEHDQIRMTRAGFEKLTSELEYLETEVRAQIAQDLKRAAADKDFRENAPYDAAKQHQGQVEARIRELKGILETGEVVDQQRRTDQIDLGSKVTLRDLEEDEEIVYVLVGPGEIDPRRGKISIQSPVGKALSGKGVGDEVEVEVPGGTVRMRVERVEH
jgi:transcription elongation factor GreA